MSRAYRIQISRSVSRVVHLTDGVSMPLELLGILPAERMKRMLLDELETRGFDVSDPSKAVKDMGDNVRIEINLEKSEVALRVEGLEEVAVAGDYDTLSDTDYSRQRNKDIQADLEKRADADLAKKAEAEEKRLQQEATKALESRLQGMRGEIDEIVTAVSGRALKERAGQMGEIEQLSESPNGELSIKIRL